jgi:lysozyme
MKLYTLLLTILYFFKTNLNDWKPVKALGIEVPLAYEIHGIDVSHHNGLVNWNKISTIKHEEFSVDFTFIKATEGSGFTDANFKTNWVQSKAAGIAHGAYHYFIPWVEASKQAELFKKTVKLAPGDLPPVLDIEEPCLLPDRVVIKGIANWLYLVEKHYGVKPIIYTNPLHYNLYIKGKFDKYPLWMANYSSKNLTKYPTSKLQFWQYSKSGRIPGIRGAVDFNVCTKDAGSFELIKL